MVYTHERKEFRFNDLVVAEGLMDVPDDRRVGRLVQVRKGVGAFGSDLIFLRLHDGSLMSYHNVLIRSAFDDWFVDAWYRSNGRVPPSIPPESEFTGDPPDVEYTLGGNWPEVGFVVESPKQPKSECQVFGLTIMKGD